ncbi:hypothetical protein V500_04060 [Pseudogymnoascus sp. VKM F-4518 (FW-2643)]|nr:hypothetical protein V500_04060 [Pseudogymnoascus sp. VKM F-4518 (FW-2643)]
MSFSRYILLHTFAIWTGFTRLAYIGRFSREITKFAMATQFPTRKLGKNGPEVPALGLGLMGLSSWYGPTAPDPERFEFLDRAVELGETFWDSADIYGDSEDLVGKWLARTGKRDDIFLATKFAFLHIGDQPGPIFNTSPKYVKIACEKSLKRLGVRCIDLYYYHRVDGVTPIEETVKAMVELKNEGMIKYIGFSEISSETLRRACKVHHIDAVQIEYSPWSLDIEHPDINLLKTCRELGVATVAYSPLGHGILTGAYKSVDDLNASDVRRYMPRFSPENFPKNLELVNALSAFAETKGCTSSQLTLAWLLA